MNKVFDNLLGGFRQLANQATPKPANQTLSIEWLNKLTEPVLIKMLGTYSATAVEQMAVSRGVEILSRKKQWIISELARRFYDPISIDKDLRKLSPAGRDGFLRIKQAGGILNLQNWQAQMEARHGKSTANKALAELVGNMLALYGQFYSSEHIEFQTTSRRHELTENGWGFGNIVLWSYPRALNLFLPNEEETGNLARSKAPLHYSSRDETPKVVREASFDMLLADIFAFMRYLEQNKVKVLQSGDIGKRDYVKLNDLMSIKDEPGKLSNARKLADLGRVNFVWRLLVETNLVKADVYQEVQLNSASNDEFYALPRYRQARLLAAAWIRSSYNDFMHIPTLNFHDNGPTDYNDIPQESQLIQARTFMLTMLENFQKQGVLPDQTWLDFKQLLALIQNEDPEFLLKRRMPQNYYYYNYHYESDYYGNGYYSGFDSKLKPGERSKNNYYLRNPALKRSEDWALVEGEWIALLFQEPLAWLGLAELGMNTHGRPVAFRLTELGQAVLANQPSEAERTAAEQNRQLEAVSPDMTKALLVQPNFDVMILAPLQHQQLLRQVDRFANQSSLGDVAMYRITKDSAFRGMRAGLMGSDILQVLNDNSRVPVAPNITTTIRDWAAEFERLVLYDNASVLETPTSEVLDRLLAHPDGPKFIAERLGPTFALIKGDPIRVDNLLQQIQREVSPVLNSRQKEVLPIFLDYSELQPGALSVEGDRTIRIAAHTGNSYLYYLLGQFADLVSWDAAKMSAEFRLSAEGGRRAQRVGLTYEEVAETIRLWLKPEKNRGFVQAPRLPLEMELALKGWLGYYSPLVAEKALSVQVTQSSQLDDIFDIPEFAPALVGRAGSRTFLVRESHFPALRARLAEWGMPVYAPEFDPPLPTPAPEVVEEVVEPEPEVETPKAGRRPKTKEKTPPKPRETAAERERKRREAYEVTAATNPLNAILTRNGASGQQDLEQLIQAISKGAVYLDIDDDDLNDGPFLPRGGRRR